MISNKEYRKLIKQLPSMRCPTEVGRRVLWHCRPLTVSKQSGQARRRLAAALDWICCMTMIIMIVVLTFRQPALPADYQQRIASNGMMLLHQIATGLNGVMSAELK